MLGEAAAGRAHGALTRVVLICMACEFAWEPELVEPEEQGEAMSSGCPYCGGWTWIGELS